VSSRRTAKAVGTSTDGHDPPQSHDDLDARAVRRRGVVRCVRSHLHVRPDGTTEVDEVVVREGKNLKGRATGIVLGVFGKRVVGKALENTVKAIEARNNGAG